MLLSVSLGALAALQPVLACFSCNFSHWWFVNVNYLLIFFFKKKSAPILDTGRLLASCIKLIFNKCCNFFAALRRKCRCNLMILAEVVRSFHICLNI